MIGVQQHSMEPQPPFLMGQSLSHTVRSTHVQSTFFAPANVEALQQGLRYQVYQATQGQHVIDRQSDVELGLIMRSVYLQEARNDDNGDVVAQVRALNAKVLAYAVPRIVSELHAYIQYQKDISSLAMPMERGQLATTKGNRTLEQRPGFI